MPTYQYACTACDERLEVVQKFSDEPLTECPACEGRLRKVFSPVGVVFKGSGFYKTDSRASTSTPAESKAGSEAKGDGKGESTVGAKTDTTASKSTGTATNDSKPAKKSSGDSKVA